MTLKQQKADYATLFFMEGVVVLNEVRKEAEQETFDRYGNCNVTSGYDELYSYTIRDFTSEEFQTKQEAYLNFYDKFIAKYTDSDFDAWPEEESLINREITSGLLVRLNDFVLCELLRLPERIARRLLDHTLEFALSEALLLRSDEYPVVTMECLYKASALGYGMGISDYQITSRIESLLPAYMRSGKVSTPMSTGSVN